MLVYTELWRELGWARVRVLQLTKCRSISRGNCHAHQSLPRVGDFALAHQRTCALGAKSSCCANVTFPLPKVER